MRFIASKSVAPLTDAERAADISGVWMGLAQGMKRGDRAAVRDKACADILIRALKYFGQKGEAARVSFTAKDDRRRIVTNCGEAGKFHGKWVGLLQSCGMCRKGQCFLCSGWARRKVVCECGHAARIVHYGYHGWTSRDARIPLAPRDINTTGKDTGLVSVPIGADVTRKDEVVRGIVSVHGNAVESGRRKRSRGGGGDVTG